MSNAIYDEKIPVKDSGIDHGLTTCPKKERGSIMLIFSPGSIHGWQATPKLPRNKFGWTCEIDF